TTSSFPRRRESMLIRFCEALGSTSAHRRAGQCESVLLRTGCARPALPGPRRERRRPEGKSVGKQFCLSTGMCELNCGTDFPFARRVPPAHGCAGGADAGVCLGSPEGLCTSKGPLVAGRRTGRYLA